jgi:thiol-disulfide isomerase/thioredoxin
MKAIFITIACFFTIISVYSQKVIEKPKIGYTTASDVKIEKIELRDTATIISFKTFSNGFFIPDKTYIQPFGEKDKMFIKGTDGIKMWTTTHPGPSGFTLYKLIFPPISNSVQKLDYGEQGGGWFIYDIQLKPLQTASVVPQDLLGNWLNISTGELAVSFYDSVAVYKSKPWSYSNVKLKKGKGSIVLKNKGNVIELFVNLDKKGLCKIGEKQDNLINCSKNPKQIVKAANGEKPYELPVFKIDSATYSGYFKGYSTRLGGKTLSVHVNDIIVGNQNTFVAEISENGFFSIKVPMYYPGEVYVRSQFYNGSVYLEPGKNLFQVIDPEDTESASLFMGESAGINSDLRRLESIYSFNYYEMRNKIVDMKAADYKTYCQNLLKKDMKALDSAMQTHTIGAKAFQIKKMELEYRYFNDMMEYSWNYESGYREKNKIPREQNQLDIKIDSLTAEYLNFITNENSNNPLAVVIPSYDIYINRLKYLDMLRPKNFSIDMFGLAEELEKSGYVFSESEKKLISTKDEQKAINAERKALQDKYKSAMEGFQNKYGQIIQDLHKTHKNTLPVDTIIKYIENKGMQLTADEKEYLKKSDELSKKASKAYSPDSVNAFYDRHEAFLNKMFSERRKSARNENLEKLLGVKKGFVTDIMDAQDVCRSMIEEYAVLSDNDLKAVQSQISTPFISDYIANCNNQAKLRIEANKLKKGYVVNAVPKTEADKLFDSIMVKYKGKVVYVDFWATWCGPCRSGIEEIAPLKEEMAGENVAFVYITGTTSPEGTWTNMIPNIKGEHYRVSSDEWNYLCAKFNISGIPHYTLVGKDGRVINPNLSHMGNDGIKAELKKWMNE